ncbi:uncharacterized protein EV420DRAFT_1623207 [Desarmillaria tabescens]|uniref:C2H2-type domain-containing protein n=1 Tax=Armillaria tabescens TaxID=1929756 RepID=A0AA39JAP5_ARMTA|nr:uncharacterized protein EV420DRAFT_1623207 [Desarmillaria tabescens]KAK0439300.1 hypothetical protein EV420DRAFT_1623207 [Desarmillaria tabescens]
MSHHRCPWRGCFRMFKHAGDLTKHVNSCHHILRSTMPAESDSDISVSSEQEVLEPHGAPVDADAPAPRLQAMENVWVPFNGEVQFHLADFLFRKVEMSQGDINNLMDLWALDIAQKCGGNAPFDNYETLYKAIDEIRVSSAPWKCFEMVKQSYQVWFRDPDIVIQNILANRDFAKEFDAVPYIHPDSDGQRCWSDFMFGNFAWRHAIYDTNPDTKGAMYVSIILGSDKMMVSIDTPSTWHCNGVVPIGFLAIPKSDRKYDRDIAFRVFKKKLYHQSLTAILHSLVPAMTNPVVRQCPDGYYQRVIYDLGPYIADYREQVLLAGIVQGWCAKCVSFQANLDAPGDQSPDVLWDNYGIDEDILPFTFNFPRADIHEMLSSDLLHQIIKGSFKDHLVEWVYEYLVLKEGEVIAAMPPFPGLRRFPHGRCQVYLSAVAEYLPESIMKALSAFMDFCYLVRRSDFSESSLHKVQDTIQRYHHYHEAFKVSGVQEDFSLPCQHAIIHYPSHIMEFGAPNGLCSSITESRHITAVKKPWQQSNRYDALSQMLLTNQRLDKLSALHTDLVQRGLVEPVHSPVADPFEAGTEDEGAVDGERFLGKVTLARMSAHESSRRIAERLYPKDLQRLGQYIVYPHLPELMQHFLREQLSQESTDNAHVLDSELPIIDSSIRVFHSAIATFYSPSDISGMRGMRCERIRATLSWHGYTQYDCALAVMDQDKAGFRGMNAVRVLLFFSFKHDGREFPCALVHWFKTYGRGPDPKTGMWIVRPDFRGSVRRSPVLSVIHLDTLLRGAHLLPFHYSRSLDCFEAFYVNRYADHHMHEIII